MQITFDTTNRIDLKAIRALIDVMLPQTVSVTVTNSPTDTPNIPASILQAIKPEDNPSTGLDTKELFSGGNVVQLPGTAPAIDRDAEGLPWDERIHSSTKKKTDAGVWQLKRGVNNDKAMLARVKAELKATLALPAGAAPQTANVAPVFPQAQAAAPAVTLPTSPVQSALPAVPLSIPSLPSATLPLPVTLPPLPAAVVVPQPDPQTVAELMQRVGPALATLKMPPQAIQEACTRLSIPSLEALVSANRPDLVTAVWKELQPLTV